MKYLTEEKKENALIEAEKKARGDEELTEEEQDILYEKLQNLERMMSCYSDGGPAPPPWIDKLTKYYSITETKIEGSTKTLKMIYPKNMTPLFQSKEESTDLLPDLEPSLTPLLEMEHYKNEESSDEKEKAFVQAKNKAYNNEELTEEEQDIIYEHLQAQERRMSRYLDGGPAPPIDLITKLTKYYTNVIINPEAMVISKDFLKKAYENKCLEDYCI